jgi:hypothetical protein
MDPDLEVDTDGLRAVARALTGTASRVTDGELFEPSVPTTPHWSTTDAAMLAGDAARGQLTSLAAEITETARRITAAAEAYEQADARAATRLRLSR